MINLFGYLFFKEINVGSEMIDVLVIDKYIVFRLCS